MIDDIKRAVLINVEEPAWQRAKASGKIKFPPFESSTAKDSASPIPGVSIVPNGHGGRPILNLPAGSTFQVRLIQVRVI